MAILQGARAQIRGAGIGQEKSMCSGTATVTGGLHTAAANQCAGSCRPEAARVLLGGDDGWVLARAPQDAALLHPRLHLLVPRVLHKQGNGGGAVSRLLMGWLCFSGLMSPSACLKCSAQSKQKPRLSIHSQAPFAKGSPPTAAPPCPSQASRNSSGPQPSRPRAAAVQHSTPPGGSSR